MKKTSATAIVTATILALLACYVPSAYSGENTLASGSISIASNAISGSQTVGIYDTVKGQEWGEIVGFRVYNGSVTTAYVTVTCTDLDGAVTLISSENSTNLSAMIQAGTTFSIPGTNLYGKNLTVTVGLTTTNSGAAVTCPYLIYTK